jgi:hypothetical protein
LLTAKAESVSVKYWEIIADNLKKRGWSLGWVSAVDRRQANDLDRLAPAGPPRDACAYPETKPDVPCEGSNSVR